MNLTSAQLYQRNENEKKRKYSERCRQSEKGGFCCLVHSTTGGMAPECEAFNKQLAHRIAGKRKDDYSAVANYIRTKIRFALLRSVLISLRGVRDGASRRRTRQRQHQQLPSALSQRKNPMRHIKSSTWT